MTGAAVPLTIAGALFYAFIGLNALTRPRQLLKAFDLIAESGVARNEIRGVYGGLPLAFALVLIGSLWLAPLARGILVCVALTTLGIAAGRAVSAIIDREFKVAPQLWCLLELGVGAALLAAAAPR